VISQLHFLFLRLNATSSFDAGDLSTEKAKQMKAEAEGAVRHPPAAMPFHIRFLFLLMIVFRLIFGTLRITKVTGLNKSTFRRALSVLRRCTQNLGERDVQGQDSGVKIYPRRRGLAKL
jgi:hypothetical protein